MKKFLIIIGFLASIISLILAVTPLFKLAIFPLIIAFICGIAILYLFKKNKNKPKSIQYIFLLVIIAISFVIYKSIFNTAEVGNVDDLERKEEKSEEDAIEVLEGLDIDE